MASLEEKRALIRQDWRVFAIASFMSLFGESFGIDFDIDQFEQNLTESASDYVVPLISKLLMMLTTDRTFNKQHDGWLIKLRKEYNRRDPDNATLGSDRAAPTDSDAPKDWEALDIPQQIQTVHALCEWHLHNADRFRNNLKNPADELEWRVEPHAQDAKHIDYWYVYPARLWCTQGNPPPKPSSKKRKAQLREQSRPAKNASLNTKGKGRLQPRPAPRPEGARSSSRLQQATKEYTINDESDDDSDTSSMSSLSSLSSSSTSDQDVATAPAIVNPSSDGWQTICANLEDWNRLKDLFVTSKHPGERKLYKLAQEVIPDLEAAAARKERERKNAERKLEAILMTRKKSSRIAKLEAESDEKSKFDRDTRQAAYLDSRLNMVDQTAANTRARNTRSGLRDGQRRNSHLDVSANTSRSASPYIEGFRNMALEGDQSNTSIDGPILDDDNMQE